MSANEAFPSIDYGIAGDQFQINGIRVKSGLQIENVQYKGAGPMKGQMLSPPVLIRSTKRVEP